MKTVSYLFLLLCTWAMTVACNSNKAASAADSDSTKWRGLDAYHHVMAKVYHPYKENKDLAPLKKLADSLAAEADRWTADPIPHRVENAEIRSNLDQLKAETHQLADSVKAGAKEEGIGTSLIKLHEHFHHIMKAWTGDKEESHEEH